MAFSTSRTAEPAANIAASAIISDEKSDPSFSDKDVEKRADRLGSVATLDEALGTLEISSKDADEAFTFLKNHPNADGVTQEAMAILADEKQLKKLVRKIDWMIVPWYDSQFRIEGCRVVFNQRLFT